MMKWLLEFIKKHFKPAPAETIKPEEQSMSEPLNDEVVEPQPVVVDAPAEVQPAAPVAVVTSPLDAEKSAFANFVAFVEHGIEKLGSEAEAELVALAKKYL